MGNVPHQAGGTALWKADGEGSSSKFCCRSISWVEMKRVGFRILDGGSGALHEKSAVEGQV